MTDQTPPTPAPTSPPAGQAATLEFQHVSKQYPGAATRAIEDLSFEVGAGQICVLVGPSGCGKTTAMRLVNRMIELSGGDILLDGASIRDHDPAGLRREIGYAIQQIGLFPHRTVAQNIATVPRLLGWPKARISARVDELIELIGLDPAQTRDRFPGQLSGGQRQRIGVARALAGDPLLMLMDEPFGAIDPINRERLQNEFLRLQAELRKTIVFVTHDIDEAIKMGDRIAVLRPGGVLAQYATPAELLMAPADEFVEDFVGADRALKRLALTHVRDVDLWTPALARSGDATAEVRARLAGSDVPVALLVDADGRPQAWLEEHDLRGPVVGEVSGRHSLVTVERDDILRDALSDLLARGVYYGAVVDRRGTSCGALSIEVISDYLVEHGAETEHPPPERIT
ncbi:MAG TPA: ABC transporter ATP-binding protein [Solirubrobacteraceae bacterium]